MIRRTFRAGLLAASLGLVLAPAARAAGTMTVALELDDGNWDPIATFTLTWGRIGSNLFDALLLRTPDLKLQPGLALSWEYLDNNARLRFHLRPGVKFHDGEAFNAAAVKYTFDRLLGPQGAKGPQQANYTAIGSVDVIDDMTVDFHLKSPDPVLLTKLSGYGAMIVPPDYIKTHGDDYFAAHPVGTGPFKFISYTPKVDLKLEANPAYWAGPPHIDNLTYRFIPEASTEVAELQSGGIDMATLVPISVLDTLKADKNIHVESITGPLVVSLRFNTANGITKDVAVRKAIIQAVDRDSIISEILQGNGAPIASYQSKLSFGYDPALKPLAFDPDAARTALKKAGVPANAAVTMDFVGADSTFREVTQAVAGFLQNVGLNPKLQSFEANPFYNDIIPKGKTGSMFQMEWGGWTFDYDNTAYLLYHTGQHWNPYDHDPELDKLLDQERSSFDKAEREKILQHIAAAVADEAIELPLYNLNTIYAVRARVHGLAPTPDTRFRFTDVTLQ